MRVMCWLQKLYHATKSEHHLVILNRLRNHFGHNPGRVTLTESRVAAICEPLRHELKAYLHRAERLLSHPLPRDRFIDVAFNCQNPRTSGGTNTPARNQRYSSRISGPSFAFTSFHLYGNTSGTTLTSVVNLNGNLPPLS